MKKKNVHKKKKKKAKRDFDRHHIFYIKNEWNKGELEKLRMHPYCVIDMHRETIHRFLHVHLAYIPTPRECSVGHILYQLQCLSEFGVISLDDPIEKRLMILIALFDYIEPETAEGLKAQLKLVREYNKSAQ